jgi:hypothetical protein
MHRLLRLIVITAVALTLTAPAAVARTGPSPGATPSAEGCPALDLNRLHAPAVFRYGLTAGELASEFLDEDSGYRSRGYLPERLTGVLDGAEVEFATRWVKVAGPERFVQYGLTDNAFHNAWLTHKDNYRMVDVSGFNTAVDVRFNIIWERNTAGLSWRVYHGKTAAEMQALVATNKVDGYAPERVEGYRNQQGDLRFVSTWVSAPRCDWQMNNFMTPGEYQDAFDSWARNGYRLQHVDATSWQSAMRFHAIWWKQTGPGWQARTNRDWYLYQQYVNNNWCSGYALTNFYTADNSAHARYGGIWTFDAPVTIDDSSPLADQVREEVDCAPGRGGTAIFNLYSGEQTLVHGDQLFGGSSTVKAAILYVLLHKLETEGTSLMTPLDLPTQIGSNNAPDDVPPPLAEDDDETIEYLARIMIDYSNNWAANRLIQYIGEDESPADVMTPINDALEALGMHRTRLNRYMTGTGSPSIHGTTGSRGDYEAGYDNVTTPREFAYFLQLMHVNPGLLSQTMYEKYWELLGLNGKAHDGALNAGVGNWPSEVDQFTKSGSNKWGWDDSSTPWVSTASPGDYAHRPQLGSHVQRSEVGRLVLDNGQVVVYATFFNDAEKLPSYTPFENALDCIQVEVAREYSGTSTGNVLTQCR